MREESLDLIPTATGLALKTDRVMKERTAFGNIASTNGAMVKYIGVIFK